MPYSEPILLIFGPLMAALVAYLLGYWSRARVVSGIVAALILAVAIANLNLGQASPGEIGLFSGDTWIVGEQSFVLDGAMQGLLVILWLGMAFLFLLAYFFPQNAWFAPAALAVMSPLSAALLAQPVPLKAVLLLSAVALLIMTYQPANGQKPYGALRYLVFFVFALPFLLLAAWLLESSQGTLFSASLIRALFLALTLTLAGFPFFMWVYPLVAEAPFLVPTLIFGVGQTAVVVVLYSLASDNLLVLQDPQLLSWLRWSGIGTILVAAYYLFMAGKWRFIFGNLILFSMGFALLSFTLPAQQIWETAIQLHLTRIMALLVLGGAFYLLQQRGLQPAIESSLGMVRQSPLGMALLIYGFLSLAGAPLTPGFSSHWVIISRAWQEGIQWLSILLLLAGAIAIFAILRFLPQAIKGTDGQGTGWAGKDPQWLNGLIAVLLLFLIFISLFPQLLPFGLSQAMVAGG